MRPSHAVLSLVVLTTVPACAGRGGTPSSSPPVLGYSVEEVTRRGFTQADTTDLALDMGGQRLDVDLRTDALLDVEFEPSAAGVRVTASWRELDAVMTNPLGAPERASEEDVQGPLVFTLDRKGAAQVVSLPQLGGSARQLVVPQGTAQEFFPRLPGTPPSIGMSWTDTVAYEADQQEARSASEIVLSYTVVGDTLVGGEPLLKVRMEGSGSSFQEGVTQGMDFSQELSGTVDGYFLWDLDAGVLRYQWSRLSYSGTMTVPAAPFPMGVTMRSVSHVRLVEDR